jgi:hypothetical protein
MKKIDVFKEIFTKERTCDLCNAPNSMILRAVIHPVFEMVGDEMVVTGVLLAKKCKKCCEEASK